MPVSSRFRAPAKINWDLYIYPQDECGLHPISSITTTVNLYDFIDVLIYEGDEIIVDSPVSPGEDNIVWKTVQIFKKYTGLDFSVHIRIEKNIPHGAGLGGGSSDAMTVLKALNAMMELHLSKDEICAIGSEAGSDVPLFFRSGWSLVEGFGEKIQEIEGFDADFIIVYPNKPLSTSDVYKTWDEQFQSAATPPNLQKRLQNPYNSLTDAAVSIEPEIEVIISRLQKYGCEKAQMTGSGSAVFGVVSADSRTETTKKMMSLGYSAFEVSTFK
ncbi:MAG TPA: 4-(cytidine 5'-diphospho)-2-C-methyl-D-erythritol kinase [Caldisericia bacterium]|nr:4-(cytidine 5'-diphospho)-2-C-methyl-D-erythritol kinase [Caldisericia bacterium]